MSAQESETPKKAAVNGIPETSRFFRADNQPNSRGGNQEYEAPLLKETKNVPQTVIKHLRSTKGQEFKFEKQAVMPREEAAQYVRPDLQKKILDTTRQRYIEQNLTSEPLPNCAEDRSERKASPINIGPTQGDVVFFDTLFIRKSDMPLDPDIVFGPEVQVIQYDGTRDAPENIAMRGAHVPCLPYRIRATPHFFIRDRGNLALMNYTKDPNGKGELNDVIKTKLQRR